MSNTITIGSRTYKNAAEFASILIKRFNNAAHAAGGKYKVKVVSVQPFEDRHIFNVALANPELADECTKLFTAKDYAGALNCTQMSGNAWDGGFLPTQGETITVEVGMVNNKAGDAKVLRITGHAPIAVTETSKVSLGISVGKPAAASVSMDDQ